jgi:SecD/SecF fusion protein
MLENVGRKLILIAALLGASLLLILLPNQPIRMGLDIAGGTRLLYKLNFDEALKTGAIGPDEDRAQVLEDTIAIIRKRVDPKGVREPIIRRAGDDRIEIQLPGSVDVRSSTAIGSLQESVTSSSAGTIFLAEAGEDLTGFPGGGGTIRIGSEDIRYEARFANELRTIRRGTQGTDIGEHAAGAAVLLVSDDSIKNSIENLADLSFFPAAQAPDYTSLSTDQQEEQKRLTDWLAKPENEKVPVSVYNSLTPVQGGAPAGLLWFPPRTADGVEPTPRAELPFVNGMGWTAVMRPPEKWTFTGADVNVYPQRDNYGYPAVGFQMKTSARIAFGDFTEQYVKQQVAFVLNDEVVTAPEIKEALYGQSIIEGGPGGFTDREVKEMVNVLRSGSLKIRPQLEAEEKVGATLGAEYVKRGAKGGLIALAVTLLFMAVYYRRLGMFACVALAANLTMLMGAMVLLQGTLTLPGIAGIILTVGMAVDANILIFDRIREEAEKGRKPIQAAKDGFSNAFSAIFDANVTTLITALILYNVGTGPIRGFAVTLSIGIVTSMFAALMITRVLVHLQVEKGVEAWSMSRWLADAKFQFMGLAKPAMMASTVAVLGGCAFFLILPDNDKLGIDFLGGARVKVRTEQALEVEEVRALVGKIPGDIGATAEVAALPVSEAEDDHFREFAITFKTPSDSEAEQGAEVIFEREVRAGLASVLQKGPVEASVLTVDGTSSADIVLYFEDDNHSTEDVSAVLASTGLTNLDVQQRTDPATVFVAKGNSPPGIDGDLLKFQLQTGFDGATDSGGRAFSLARPIPEVSVIGAQVVGELRDSAIKAILLSIFLVVMYIRIRFAEYSYGFAAVAAVVHDVLITLGAVALLVKAPFIQIEMNLTMIAAFLTILGYSLNDTIVIFDRVRENLPRVKGSLSEIVNLSINQTLSRTVVTSLTTLTTILVVLFFNLGTGNVLEGFMFALAVGVLSGTYSTIFIACPTLVWLEERARKKGERDVVAIAQKGKSRPKSEGAVA